jgi:hypothetical protein
MKAIGERNARAKLNPSKVRRMRRRYARGNISLRALGSLNGVAHTTARRVVCRITWRAVR